MNSVRRRELERQLLADFRAKLATKHGDRKDSRGPRPFSVWHEEEIAFMHVLVNQERAELGRPYLRRAVIERAESCASGHVDYALKFALYCRDLVFSDTVEP